MTPIIPIANEQPWSSSQRTTLRLLAGLMIPASARHGVPGADDEIIFNDILNTLAPQAGRVSEMLRDLDAFAGQPFATLSADQQDAFAQTFRKHRSPGLMAAVSARRVWRIMAGSLSFVSERHRPVHETNFAPRR